MSLSSAFDNSSKANQTQRTMILNDLYAENAQPLAAFEEFPYFSRFPKEICLAIWQINLRHHRLIGVNIAKKNAKTFRQAAPYTTRNSLGNIVSGGDYIVQLRARQRLSPLFATCRQARQAAMDFYRVQLPYSAHTEQLCIYLNPEYDFVDIDLPKNGLTMIDFLYDLRAYDPRGIGILNLVVGTPEPHLFSLPRKPSKLSASMIEPLSVFTQILDNLKRVVFHHRIRAHTRLTFTSIHQLALFNRSFPIFSFAESFKLLEVDPRPIDTDLSKISVGLDPRIHLFRWQKMEEDFGVRATDLSKYQYLITHAPGKSIRFKMDKTIPTRETADMFLRLEESAWSRRWDAIDLFAERNIQDIELSESTSPLPAFGFWLFPSEAFGEMPKLDSSVTSGYSDGDFGISGWDTLVVADLTKFRPQIGLFTFP